MTNLEFYIKDIDRKIDWCIQNHSSPSMNNKCTALKFILKDTKKPYRVCSENYCQICLQNSLEWLLEEHKEPIKLKQWEYDLLLSIQRIQEEDTYRFKGFRICMEMKEKGYFEGVTDTLMTLKEILDNCEVIE